MDGPLTASRAPARGFTLIEIAIVVAIVMTILTMGLGLVSAQLSSTAYSLTKKRQDAVKDALIAYLGANKRLPCPYVPTSGAIVTGIAPAQSGSPLTCPGTGIVPFATLGVGRENATDGWGNYFTYRVFTDAAPSCPGGSWDWGNASCFGEGKDGISPARSAQTINDGTVGASTVVTDKSIAVVISHGPNGFGAWAAQGTRNVAATNCEEAHNAPGTTAPVGCAVTANVHYKGEREGNDDVVSYLSAGDALQTLVKQGAIKSPITKANEDLQILFDAATGVKRSNINVITILGLITISSGECQATVNTTGMNALRASMRDPWGAQYSIAEGPGGFPICIYSQGGGGTTCTVSGIGCASSSPVICKTLDKTTFNGYMTKTGGTCP